MADQQHSRRDFLRGKAAAAEAAAVVSEAIDAAGEAVERRLAGTDSPEVDRRRHVMTLARRAMACEFELRLCASAERNDTEAGMAALDLVERLEDQLTVYRDESELIDINRRAASEAVEVEPRLFGLLQLAGDIHRQTDGAFDLTSGPLSRVWGFHRREGALPDDDAIREALVTVGWDHVTLDQAHRTIRFDRRGVELNVNSIGKGYALDRAGELLAERGVADSLMHGGRSTLLARGDNHLLAEGGWRAGVRDPLNPTERLAEFTLRDQALSTSGSGTQFFEHEGRRYGHLIDPRTGWPGEGLYSATVIAPTAAEADALSTAAYLLGVEGTSSLCAARPEVAALLLAPPDGGGETVVHAFNLGAIEHRLHAEG